VLPPNEDKQTEHRDGTASPNNESASENVDYDADTKYTLRVDAYSDISVNNSSLFDETNVFALNEPQTVDKTTTERTQKAEEQENRMEKK
jgi:hypothetical protein